VGVRLGVLGRAGLKPRQLFSRVQASAVAVAKWRGGVWVSVGECECRGRNVPRRRASGGPSEKIRRALSGSGCVHPA